MTAVRQQQAQSGMSIGSVLDRLRPDFPDVTISKIRFLEAEGLISPQRTPSGYRRFSIADCERLRYVLTAQRDQYLPLKVIKEQLEAIDRGVATVGAGDSSPRRPRALTVAPGEVSPEEFRTDREVRICRDDLISRAGIDEKFLGELTRGGLVVPGPAGFFDEDAVTLARTARAMSEFGLEVRHLRAFKLAADREAGLVAQIAGPVAKGRDAGARDRAEEMVRELAALSLTLHTCLVKSAVRGALDR
ncbi:MULTISPECIES: transcriptional regulator FtsR [Rhodococcus]|uniref:Transcriptional regulator n=1 Tax=Rhodococcus opacus RKJ300 = JCM 13270 TaxID=1165867 RepID=I0WZU7_RHOOP|nr:MULTISPECIES: MerR family transcriptional regulator [Rhodococcus]EID81913.1 transcriptional regulator [Rhodococcus opacus RKJ300 = JCM 13270]QQZ16443.1 MerR family DNA-binding transcriptional regulator [Rhodococcus sp. 21391]